MNQSGHGAAGAVGRRQRWRRAFTRMEVLIVLLVLSLLALIVRPRLASAAGDGREAHLRAALRLLRTQILVYRAEHHGVAPGYPGGDLTIRPTPEAFVDQLTCYTTESGRVTATPTESSCLGPYLPAVPGMPVNPINGSADLRFIGRRQPFPTTPIGPEGWVYQPSTAILAPNCDGVDSRGLAYFDY